MALPDVVLSMLAFPQRVDAGVLQARVLLLPATDPRAAAGGLPQFSGTTWKLRSSVLPGLDSLIGAGGGAAAQTLDFTAAAPAGAANLFDALNTQYAPVPPAPTLLRRTLVSNTRIRKSLPQSYTQAFAFDRPGPDTTLGDEFGCALRGVTGGLDTDRKPDTSPTWGAILSFALRQPDVARALGLIHDFSIKLDPPDILHAGGWLFVELDPAGGLAPAAGAVRSYAARLPLLDENASRPLFGAVLIPTGLAAEGDYGDALLEAATYDDGFAKIVHASQAVTADATSAGHNKLPPGTDAGLDIGWDDEQVTVWLNRQLDCLRIRLGAPPTPGAKSVEAPLGIGGYRLDVRQLDPAAGGAWESLCRAFSADADGKPAALRFPAPPAPIAFSSQFDGELSIEPAPVRNIHSSEDAAWLPMHFARWQGGSLVVSDTTLHQLTGTAPPDAMGKPIDAPVSPYRAPPVLVHLRYGREYEIRCRLADLTGGGPDNAHGDVPLNPAQQRTAKVRFLRHLPPKVFRVESDAVIPAPGKPTPAVTKLTSLKLRRPLIGYPEMMFAGIDDPGVIAALIAQAGGAKDAGKPVGVRDPDVTHVRISVQVRAPGNDPGPADLRDGAFREIYATEMELPALNANPLAADSPLDLSLEYLDVPDVAQMDGPAGGSTTLPIPSARDVRIRLTPLCAKKPDYFGSDAVRFGLTSDIATRADAEAESRLEGPLRPGQTTLAAILLQPGTALLQRVADRLHLAADGLTLAARPGERVVFAASGALRHSLSPEGDRLTFASEAELLGHWLAILQVEVARDWTWNGMEDYGYEVSRAEHPGGARRVIGRMAFPFSVSSGATSGPDRPGEDRRARTRLVFLDGVDSKPAPNTFPRNLHPEWRIEPRLRGFDAAGDAAHGRTESIVLPIAVPPRQTPAVISAGIALSPYASDGKYSSTSPRTRVLWLEFDTPPADPNDALFARVLAYGPDPLLSGTLTHRLLPAGDLPIGPTTLFDVLEKSLPHPPPPPDLAVDPEPMRVIVPLQPEDSSGLDAMSEMIEAFPQPGETRSRYFMLPLPPGVDADAPELFGFWTYEIRVGHKRLWSTAQARFGRPFIVQGIQHPAPTLRCTAVRIPADGKPPAVGARIVVSAPHATAVYAGKPLTDVSQADPRTRLWVLLYAQVTQADGDSYRNVLLARLPAPPRIVPADVPGAGLRDIMGIAAFSEDDVQQRLAELALSSDSPLSVVAVELLPGDHLLQKPVRDGTIYVNVDVPEFTSEKYLGIAARSDPLGADLGTINSRRILRCSPLTPVAPSC